LEKITKILELCLEAGIIGQSTVNGTLASIQRNKEWLERHLEDIEKWLRGEDPKEVKTIPSSPTSEVKGPTGIPKGADQKTLGASTAVVSFTAYVKVGVYA
jgi:hypothetical protein